jgi:hypothetical protein
MQEIKTTITNVRFHCTVKSWDNVERAIYLVSLDRWYPLTWQTTATDELDAYKKAQAYWSNHDDIDNYRRVRLED